MKQKLLIFLLLPTFLLVFALLIYPIFFASYLSFNEIIGGKTVFVGLENYMFFARDHRFLNSLRVTSSYVILLVSLVIPFSLGLALLANEDLRGISFFRGALLIPYIVSPVVNGIMWKWIYNGTYGILNYMLSTLGIIPTYVYWLDETSVALFLVVIADVWKLSPLFALMVLAKLQTIPEQLYEAAKIDGANVLQRTIHITFPSIKFTFYVLLTFAVMWGLRMFDTIYMLTKGGPQLSTSVLAYYTYQSAFKFMKFGYASSLAIVNAAFILVFTLVYFKLAKIEV